MREETRIALKMFVEKSDKLLASRYVHFIREHGGTKLNYHYQRSKGWQVTLVRPDDEATETLVLTFRLFIQDNEHISFRWLAKHVLDDPGLSEEWKQRFKRVRTDVNAFLDGTPNITERVVAPIADDNVTAGADIKEMAQELVSEQLLTYRDIMNIFIYGELAHVEVSKKLVYERWKSNPFGFPLLQFEFHQILGNVLRAISYVAALTRQECPTLNTQAPPAP